MTYAFQGKSTQTIINEFMEIIDRGGARMEINEAFEALKEVTPALGDDVIEGFEDKLIAQAKRDAAAWMKSKWVVIGPHGDIPVMQEAEKKKLLGELERLRPMAQAFGKISWLKGPAAQLWTKKIVQEISLSNGDRDSVENLADLFDDVHYKVGDAPAPKRPVKKRPVKAAFDITADNQRKIKQLASRYKVRLIGAPVVGG